MATWAVGDVQGCHDELVELLDRIAFDPDRDRLWLVGDLVNRGPRSADVVRTVRGLGEAARCVLGNHDLHLLAIRFGGYRPNRSDTFTDVLAAPDCDALCHWLRGLPLLVDDPALGYVMAHAGIPHVWSLDRAAALAREVEAVLRGAAYGAFLEALYGNLPDVWDDALEGIERWRVIVNYFTRMRLVDEDGRMDFTHKGGPADAPPGWRPWYELRAGQPLGARLLFGHWASLEGETGLPEVIALDTGCVWGRALTALCLETGARVEVPARVVAGR
jgi:bis(5'-nucleosyl)-tetraphosphatase (symmetrical)